MAGTTYSYGDIYGNNYHNADKIHTVIRQDSLINVSLYMPDTDGVQQTVSLQVFIGGEGTDPAGLDADNQSYWSDYSPETTGVDISPLRNDDGLPYGIVLATGISGFTGVRIYSTADEDDPDQRVTLYVREYFPPEKIKNYDNNAYLVT